MSFGLDGLDEGFDRRQVGQVGLDFNAKDSVSNDYQIDTHIAQEVITLQDGFEFGQDGTYLWIGAGLVNVGLVGVVDSKALET